MPEFSTSLVREKIVFIDDAAAQDADASPVSTVRSNRIYLQLQTPEGTEKMVIRTQTMPTALRLASKVMFSYYRNGLFSKRAEPYDWQAQWASVLSGYDEAFVPDLWAAVYINGQSIFKTVKSPFVDVVEQCALLSIDNYDAAMGVTEDALRRIGRAMRINHSSNVAAIFVDNDESMRCGIIHRLNGRDSTFNFTAAGGDVIHRIVQSLVTAAAFVEAIDLQRTVAALQAKVRDKEIPRASADATKLRAGTARMVVLDKAIKAFEEAYDVKYRPQKPDFFAKSF